MRSITGRLRLGFGDRTSDAGGGFRAGTVRRLADAGLPVAAALLLCTPGCATGSPAARAGGHAAPADTPAAVSGVTPSLRVIRLGGTRPGPTVALVAGVHGGKRSAMRALERLAESLPREPLRGTLLLVPVANAPAAGGGLAQLSPLDSLNLNRVFPGRADGRPTERLAHALMREVVAGSDYLVDLHGADGEEQVGAFAYAARPGLDPRVDSLALRLATLWGTPRVVWDEEGPRTLATARFLQTAAHL